ncbi:MAG: hypothetical protein ACI9VR_002970 [Cognaticolwellia sp.]|jgi:hypothetical protein
MPLGLLVLAMGAAWVLARGWWQLSSPALLPPPSARESVVVLGDGIARGAVGTDWIESFNAEQSRVVLLNYGRSFAECAELVESLQERLEHSPKRLIIVAGSREVLAMAAGDAQARERLEQGCSALCSALSSGAGKSEIKAAWMTPPLMGERATGPLYDALLSAAEVIESHASAHGITVIPLHVRMLDHLGPAVVGSETRVDPGRVAALRLALAQTMLGRSSEELSRDRGWRLTVDGIHLNARGADLLQEMVQTWLGRS